MENIVFGTNINRTGNSGLINTENMNVLCFCTKENAEILIKAIEKSKSYDELEDKINKFYDGESEGDLVDIGEAAATHFGFL